jgi:hypothetical protein
MFRAAQTVITPDAPLIGDPAASGPHHLFTPLDDSYRARVMSRSTPLRAAYDPRIGSVPQRLCSRPPSVTTITTTISFGRGASATDTIIVLKCAKDQESSLCPSGTSRLAPAAATFTFDEITALPPPIAARIGYAEHRVDAGTAVLHLAVYAYDCAFAVRDSRPVEQLDELGHDPLAEHRPGFEERPEIADEAAREGIDDHGPSQSHAQPAAAL